MLGPELSDISRGRFSDSGMQMTKPESLHGRIHICLPSENYQFIACLF